MELLEGPYDDGDEPQHDADRPPLLEHVDPEAAEARDAVGAVQLVPFLEPFLLAFPEDDLRHRREFLGD